MKKSIAALTATGLVFGFTPLVRADGGVAPEERELRACVLLGEPGPGLADAPTLVEFDLAVPRGVGEFNSTVLVLTFVAQQEGGITLSGDELRARFVGSDAWSEFGEAQDVSSGISMDECPVDEPDCDLGDVALQAVLPVVAPPVAPARLAAEILRTTEFGESMKLACLIATYSDEGFVDAPDLGPPVDNIRDAAFPDGDGTYVIDAGYPPGEGPDSPDPAPREGVPPDAGSPVHEPVAAADDFVDAPDLGIAPNSDAPAEESSDQESDHETKADSCNAMSNAPTPFGLFGLVGLVLLGLRGARRTRNRG